ncbi:MAG: hypothetical protein ACP5RI_02960 [Candidatus Micrarchaeia archaeon]
MEISSSNNSSHTPNKKILINRNILIIAIIALAILSFFYYLSTLHTPSITTVTRSATSMCASSSNYSNCIQVIAVQSSNSSICNDSLAGYQRAQCIQSIALKNNNIIECNSITSNYSINCKLMVINKTKNYSDCSLLAQPYSDLCIYKSLSNENFSNISVCSNIQNATDKSTCEDLYYLNKAVKSKSASSCADMSNKTSFSTMYVLLTYNSTNINSPKLSIENITSGSYLSNLNFTDYQLFLDSTPKDYCYYTLSKIENNSSMCNSITSNLYKNLCLSMFVHTTLPLNVKIDFNASNAIVACSNNTNATRKKDCYLLYNFTSAIKTYNTLACNTLGNSLGPICITAIAVQQLNSSLCNTIQNTTFHNICYNDIILTKPLINITNFNTTILNISKKTNFTAPNIT